MDISQAMTAAKNGAKVRRSGWHNELYLTYIPATETTEATLQMWDPATPENHSEVAWFSGYKDIITEDWEIVP